MPLGNRILLWCCLKLVLDVLVLRTLGRDSGEDQCQTLTMTDWSWTTCLELQSYPQFVANSAGPGFVSKGPSRAPSLPFISIRPKVLLAKVPMHLEIYPHLPPSVSCLSGSVTERASGAWIAWGRFSVSHQVRMSGVHKINTGSISVPVLGQSLCSKCPRVYQVYLPPCWVLHTLVCGMVSGSCQGEASRVYQDQNLAV